LPRFPRPSAEPGQDAIRLVVVEPRPILGVGVLEILDRAPDIEVLAYVTTPGEAVSVVDEVAPDVLLVDVALPEPDATEATRALRQGAPNIAMVVMGREDDDASIVGAAEVGAVAHVGEMADPAELVATIRLAAEGGDPLKDELSSRPDLLARIVDDMREAIFAGRPIENPLSARELHVLALVASGATNREISENLGLSEQTVKNHLSSIFHKLGVANRTEAVTYASRHAWLDLDEIPEGAPDLRGRDET
jgi:DNA-binding NarL/FixJ family response regulator